MKQLPESFCIAREGRTPETCPRWKRFIEWFNNPDNVFHATGYKYYGYWIENKRFASIDLNEYKHVQLLTIDQFEEIMGWKEPEEFALPEQWCILTTKENVEDVRKWFFENIQKYPACRKSWTVNVGGYYYSPGVLESGGWATDDELRLSDYGAIPEITYDQFKKYILKKEPEQWQPKPGEMVQVSQDDIKWYDREFFAIAYNNSKGKQYGCYTDGHSDLCCWKFCRPIPKVTTYSRSEAIKLLSEHTGKPESEITIE